MRRPPDRKLAMLLAAATLVAALGAAALRTAGGPPAGSFTGVAANSLGRS